MELVSGEGWRQSDLFNEREKAVIGWAEAVTRLTAKRDEAAWQAMLRHFSIKDVVTLTAVAGFTNCSNRVAEALHLLPEAPGERIKFQQADGVGPRPGG